MVKIPLSFQIMGTWTKQKGYPVLTLTKEKDGTVYRVVQVRSCVRLSA